MLLLQYFLLDAIGTFLGGPSNVNVNMTESQVTDRSSRVLNSGDQAELLENFLNSIVGFFVGSFFLFIVAQLYMLSQSGFDIYLIMA